MSEVSDITIVRFCCEVVMSVMRDYKYRAQRSARFNWLSWIGRIVVGCFMAVGLWGFIAVMFSI